MPKLTVKVSVFLDAETLERATEVLRGDETVPALMRALLRAEIERRKA